MPGLKATAASTATIKEFLNLATSKTRYAVIYASLRPNDGLMWCGDCRKAEPLINAKFEGREEDVKAVFAGSQIEWRNTTNPWRQPPFSIKALPTIVKVNGDKWEQLVEEDCYDEAKLDAFTEDS